ADSIERIEVIRGPQSTLYGADAIGGVVNIITKRGKGPFSAAAEQQVGNYDTYVSRASVQGAPGPFDYALGVFHLESNGQFPNDNARQTAVNLRLGVALPYNSDVAFTLRWNETNTGLPVKFTGAIPLPITPVIDRNNENLSDTLITTVLGHTRPVEWWESSLRAGRYININNFVDLPDPGFP